MQKVYITESDEETKVEFNYRGYPFEWIMSLRVGMSQNKVLEEAILTARASINMLSLLGYTEYVRQQQQEILGKVGSYDQEKLKDIEVECILLRPRKK